MKMKIYDQHKAAFANVSAYVIMKGGARVATIAFKYPKDGAGRLWCYAHYFNLGMARGYAGGYGYDKRSAAAQGAVENIEPYQMDPSYKGVQWAELHAQAMEEQRKDFQAALHDIGGADWSDALRNAGYEVLCAV